MTIKNKEIFCFNKTTQERQTEKFVGKKFNKLLIVEVIGKDKNNRTFVKALCDCGGFICTGASEIKGGRARSCGCIRKQTLLLKKTKN